MYLGAEHLFTYQKRTEAHSNHTQTSVYSSVLMKGIRDGEFMIQKRERYSPPKTSYLMSHASLEPQRPSQRNLHLECSLGTYCQRLTITNHNLNLTMKRYICQKCHQIIDLKYIMIWMKWTHLSNLLYSLRICNLSSPQSWITQHCLLLKAITQSGNSAYSIMGYLRVELNEWRNCSALRTPTWRCTRKQWWAYGRGHRSRGCCSPKNGPKWWGGWRWRTCIMHHSHHRLNQLCLW